MKGKLRKSNSNDFWKIYFLAMNILYFFWQKVSASQIFGPCIYVWGCKSGSPAKIWDSNPPTLLEPQMIAELFAASIPWNVRRYSGNYYSREIKQLCQNIEQSLILFYYLKVFWKPTAH